MWALHLEKLRKNYRVRPFRMVYYTGYVGLPEKWIGSVELSIELTFLNYKSNGCI